VARETLVDEVRTVVRKLVEARGEVVLAMLLATSAEQDAPWNLVVSAEWMDNRSRKEVISLVTDLLRKEVSRSNWSSILMVSVLKSDDPFVQAMNRAFAVTDSTAFIQDCNVFGIEVPRAVIFESHRPKPVSATSR